MRLYSISSFGRFTCVLLALACSTLLWGQTFNLRSSATQVDQYQSFRIEFELSGRSGEAFTPPDLSDFEVASGPSTSSKTTINNGRVSSSLRISYVLMANKAGVFKIPPGSIKIANKTIQSNSLTIEVKPVDLKTLTQGLSADSDLILRLNFDKDSIYIGESIRCEIELLNHDPLRNYSFSKGLNTDGLIATELRNFNSRERKIKIEGKPYSARTVQAINLVPTKSGDFMIGPIGVNAKVYLEENVRESFFFSPPTKTLSALSNPGRFKVMELPSPVPADFIGAVGEWDIKGHYIDVENITTADAITFNLFVQGQGDVNRIEAPELAWPAGWRAYPPEVTTNEQTETQKGTTFTKVFQYNVAPTQGGVFNLRPHASYFNADSGRYIQWFMDSLTVNVKDVGTRINEQPQGASNDIVPIVGTYSPAQALWAEQSWFWILFAIMPMTCLAVFGLQKASKNKQHKTISKDPVAEGRKRLQKARASIEQPGVFYQEVREALQQYAHERLGLAPSNQSEDAIYQGFANAQGVEQAEQFLEARRLADLGLYGGGTDEEGRRKALEELEVLLSK